MFTDKELVNLPKLTIGIPVQHNTAACIMHLLRNEVSDIKVTLEDLRSEGATLILSGHIRPYPADMDMETPEEQERMKSLREFWDSYMAEQKEKLGLNNPLTLEQLERNLQLIDEEKIKFATEDCWSDETIDYCKRFEDSLFEDASIFDDWEEGEEND